MITCTKGPEDWQVLASDGVHALISDTTPEHGGGADGFRPHDLLEAALGSCINITLRMYAKRLGVELKGVKVEVNLKQDDPETSLFEYKIELDGDLSDEQRAKLLRAARSCPVHKTLTKAIVVREHNS